MSLKEAYKGARIIETNENYARADTPLTTPPDRRDKTGGRTFYDDHQFWEDIFYAPQEAWGIEFDLFGVFLSEWVARVPGLFWTPEARKLRSLAEEQIAYVASDGWRTYYPPGKSQKVMGGVGTFRLPPAADGKRLVTLTTTLNASAGVPALVSPDVWEKIGPQGAREGRALEGRGRWQAMSDGWDARFKSTRDIPRGYLVLDDPDAIGVSDERAPIQFHPFSVMEYYAGSKELFDYVYATGDTGRADYREPLLKFFDFYKDENDRFGRYLLAGDMVDPLWDAEYGSPGDLRRVDASSESQLKLLEARVRESLLGEDKIEAVLEALASPDNSEQDLARISQDIGIPPAVWLRVGSLAEMSSQFVDVVIRRDKLGELVEELALLYPNAITGREP